MSCSFRVAPAPVMRLCAVARPNSITTSFSSSFSSSASTSASVSSSKSRRSAFTPVPFQPSFSVGRSNSQNLPVYHRIKSGGTNKTTEIRKVEGNARALSKLLQEELGLEAKVNPRTNHVIIKGFHREKLVEWLNQRRL